LLSLRSDPAVATIIVINNSPGDDLETLITEITEVKLLVSHANVGFGSAVNSARPFVSNDYVVLANPDTTQEASTVSASIDFLERQPNIGLVGPRMVNPDRTTYRTSRRSMSLARMIVEKLGGPERFHMCRSFSDHGRAHETDYVIGSFVICRKEALDSVDWFDERIFLFGEDQDICRRLRASGWQIWYAPLGCVAHRSGHSWKQLDDHARESFRAARRRELRADGGPIAAALYSGIEAIARVARRYTRRRSRGDMRTGAEPWR
jgi:GT2 family glycosyltransferase